MHREHRPALLSLGCLILLLHGCAAEQHTPPQKLAIANVHYADGLRKAEQWPDAQWWTRYGDAQLDGLIEQALANAPSLLAVKARINQAHSQAQLVASATSLQISAFSMLNRQKASSNGFLGPYAKDVPELGLTGPWYTEGTLGVFASLDIDPWGRNRAALSAAIGVEQARLAEAAQARLQLATGVAQLYYSLQTTWQLEKLLQRSEQVLRLAVEAHQHKVDTGLEGQVPLANAQSQRLAVQRQIVSTHSEAIELQNSLAALVGATQLPALRPVDLPKASAGVPQDLPYSLLSRRADLQALNAYVQASLSEIDVAKAAFYPSFDIKAFFGLDSLHLSQLFKHDSQQINLIPGLTLPLFNGGSLRANLRASHAINEELIQRYNQAVLDAVRDVASRGDRLQALDQEWRLQRERIEAVTFEKRALEAAYQRGLGSRVSAAIGELPLLAEEVALLTLESQRLTQSLLLIESLGGGYDATRARMATAQ